jgi:hypothetical protein
MGGGSALIALLVLLWLPAELVPAGLRDHQDAGDFLGSLWQVEAGALALSAAVVLVAFQIFATSRYASYSGGLAGFAQDSGLGGAIAVGFLGIGAVGLALAFAPSGLGEQRAATAAAVVSAASLLATALLLRGSAQILSEQHLRTRQRDELLRQLRLEIAESVDYQTARDLIAQAFDSTTVGLGGFTTFLGTPFSADKTVRVPRGGVIKDINLASLVGALTRSTDSDQRCELSAGLSVGMPVRRGDVLLISHTALAEHKRAEIMDAFKLAEHPASSVAEAEIDLLQEEALRAIREDRRGQLVDILNVLQAAATDLPTGWRLSGKEFDSVARQSRAVALLRTSLREQASELAKRSSSPLEEVLNNFPRDLGFAALDDDQVELFDLALRIALDFLAVSIEHFDQPGAAQLQSGAMVSLDLLTRSAAQAVDS